jgi:tetratricopeptide (TPR) repeat protein
MSKLNQAITIHQKGNKLEAGRLYKEIIDSDPENSSAHHYYGLIEADRNEYENALKHLEKALVFQPENAYFHHNSAGIYSRLGQIDKAAFHFQQAFKLKPDYGEAYQGFTESVYCADQSSLLNSIEKQIQRKATTASQKCYMHFAAGKICADSKQYTKAFQHYEKGNKLKNVSFDSERNRNLTNLQIQYFNEAFVEKTKEWGLFCRTPIFIVGMPRSGTTLIEQILSCHSLVHGAGELPDIENIVNTIQFNTKNKLPYPFFLNETTLHDLLGFGLSYINNLNNLSGNKGRVINKNPLNFNYIGFILLVFPNAKIIHLQRNPLDTCLSCYFQNFAKAQEYAFDLEGLGEFYGEYHRLMSHWTTVYPNRIKTIQYEELVSHSETIIRDLLQYCDLPWEDQCLDFHKNKRGVVTASKYQIRRPIYKSSMGQWQNYKDCLQPLINKFIQKGLLSQC